jgi:hypothetical protein
MPQMTSEKSNICKGFSLSGSYRTKCGVDYFTTNVGLLRSRGSDLITRVSNKIESKH